MPITLDPETERRLEDFARVRQTDPNAFVRSLLDDIELADTSPVKDILAFEAFKNDTSARYGSFELVPDAEFMVQINRGFPEDFWRRYTFFRECLENESFDERDRPEFQRLLARREGANVERIKYVMELARRRGCTFEDLWRQFGLGNA